MEGGRARGNDNALAQVSNVMLAAIKGSIAGGKVPSIDGPSGDEPWR